jgi:hypothetical protein
LNVLEKFEAFLGKNAEKKRNQRKYAIDELELRSWTDKSQRECEEEKL